MLLLLEKSNSSTTPRLIAVDINYDWRFTAKLAVSFATPALLEHFGSLQVGVHVPNGNEAIAHVINFLMSEDYDWEDDHFLWQLDFTNAFNLVCREEMIIQFKIGLSWCFS